MRNPRLTGYGMTKLSKPQRKLLEKAITEGKTYAVNSYPPIKKLLALGYIEKAQGTNSQWAPTAKGRKVLEDI